MPFSAIDIVRLGVASTVLSASFALGVDAQEPPQRFRASTSMVLLDVSVTGKEGKSVPGLEAEDFVVLEDGVEQQVKFFEAFTDPGVSPASVVLLLDDSSSISDATMSRSREAALGFFEEKPAGAEVAVATFDDGFHRLCHFTEDSGRLSSAVEDLRPGGGTALYDALLEAVELLGEAQYQRQAIVLWTDGADLDSRARFGDVESALSTSPVTLYAVGQYGPRTRQLYMTGEKYFKKPELEENLNPVWVLERLAELTGGQAFFPADRAGVAPLLGRIGRTLQRQYLIGYQPTDADRSSTEAPHFRRIEVRLRDDALPGGSARVRARRGYVR